MPVVVPKKVYNHGYKEDGYTTAKGEQDPNKDKKPSWHGDFVFVNLMTIFVEVVVIIRMTIYPMGKERT